MFRAALRSVPGPLRDQLCVSCYVQRFEHRIRWQQFHSSTAADAKKSKAESAPKPVLNGKKRPKKSKKSKAPAKPHPRAIKRKDGETKESASQSPAEEGSADEKGIIVRKIVGPDLELVTIRERVKPGQKAKKKPKQTTSPEQETRPGKEGEATTAADESKSPAADLRPPAWPDAVLGKEPGSFDTKDLLLKPMDIQIPPVPRLSYGLERVLFNPGVYQLRDPRSRVYNFDPYLGSIMPVSEFDFTALKDYITSSKDETLRDFARKEGMQYIGSSSSMTAILCQFHYLLSAWRPIDTTTISQGFTEKLRTFTRLLRAPAAMFLHYQDGVYAIDADKEFDSANILMNLGKSMEKLLTLPKEEFERYRRSSENKISAEEEKLTPESYHYSTCGKFLMRSQLDAWDPRLPGTGMFDLKTRAVVSIRMNARNFEEGLGYQIKSRFGDFESFEREYYDMIRAAFLKYSLQVRIGRMDGIFVAFHNIQRIFGFQYISLPEMDLALHGQEDTTLGDREFLLSLGLWEKVLDKATERFPKQSLRIHFETRDTPPYMYIFVEPVTPTQIHAIQTKNQAAIDAYQQRILNLPAEDADFDEASSELTSSTDGDEKVVAEAEETPKEDADTEPGVAQPADLLTLMLVVSSKMNGVPVIRPLNLKETDTWTVDYELAELECNQQARSAYAKCRARREEALGGRGEDETNVASNVYIRKLQRIAREGRYWRHQEDQGEREKGVVVLEGAVKA